MRFSYQRETIRDIVCSTNAHPNAGQVFNLAKKLIPKISLGTVYRNLKQLEENGDLRSIYDGNIARYDRNTEPHNHLKCKKCGALVDVNVHDNDIRSDMKKKFQFTVDDIEMTIIGTCQKHTK
tara:strand:- start:64450 stop:64818 length:369 start_codon:yes stop_codon:yes gene_type:complete